MTHPPMVLTRSSSPAANSIDLPSEALRRGAGKSGGFQFGQRSLKEVVDSVKEFNELTATAGAYARSEREGHCKIDCDASLAVPVIAWLEVIYASNNRRNLRRLG